MSGRRSSTGSRISIRGRPESRARCARWAGPGSASRYAGSWSGCSTPAHRSRWTFEPRLREVRVSVVRLEDEQRTLRLRIDAVLTADEVAEPVSFPALMGLKSGRVEVQEIAD
jgi:hypothetical protein